MAHKYTIALCLSLAGFLISCDARSPVGQGSAASDTVVRATAVPDPGVPVIHIFVALCDNQYQGIVPVPAKIGNGQDPANNLYWGCAYGIRTFFKRSAEWQLLRQYQPDSIRLERLVFRHKTKNYYLVADAYDGRYIKTCTVDFLNSCAGKITDTVQVAGKAIGIRGNARLLCYIGHDGLMDFKLEDTFDHNGENKRDAMLLACYSKKYFREYLRQSGARPLLWSTGLMSPEAYTIHDAINAYVRGATPSTIRQQAAGAYARYQHCSSKTVMNLLVSGYE